MRRISLMMCAMLVFLAAGETRAGDVPNTMTVQGVLRNAAGEVVNGVYALTFKLYTAEVNGQMLWSEVHNNAAVENGVYTAALGGINPLPMALFKTQSSVWLGVSVEGQAELPRVPLSTVAYAFHSRSAMVASDLECTGCIEEGMLGFDPVSEENVVQLVKDSGQFVESANGIVAGGLQVGGTVSAAAFVGDGSGLTGITSPQGACANGWFVHGIGGDGALQCAQVPSTVTSVDGLTGGTIDGDVEVGGTLTVNGAEVCHMDGNCGTTLAQLTCQADQVAMWNGNTWVCSDFVTEFDPSVLPADGLNEISNDLLTNQFVDTFTSTTTPTAIPDNNPTGVVDSLTVPDVGTAQEFTVSINITNSDLSTVKVKLFAPDNTEYVLYDKNGPGQELGASYPDPTKPVQGDLTTWIDKNPKGIWQLQVIDTGFKNNLTDGQINAWSVQVKTLSTKKVQVAGNLITTGNATVGGDLDVTGDINVTGTIVGPSGLLIEGNGEVTGSMKIGTDDAECDDAKAGALRYYESRLQWCNGNVWNTIGEGNSMFRWAQWNTYGQNHGTWYADNRAELFGGVHPSNWGDGNQTAHHMSSNSEVLRTLFWHKGPAINSVKNAMVAADEWYYYSSTNSQHIGALFRIRNTTDQAINWSVDWYKTGYGGWNEYAGVAINGSSVWSSSSDFGPSHESNHVISIPANRTSTVIFIAASSSASGTRSNFMAFYNNSLQLPAGLEYVDDLDYKPDGWNN